MNENMTACAYCGTLHAAEEMTETSWGLVCEDCLDDHFVACENCGNYHCTEDDDLSEVVTGWRAYDREYWCNSCLQRDAFQCEDCGTWFEDDYGRHDDYGTHICDSCYASSWYTCEDCGRLIPLERAYDDEDADCYLCLGCYTERQTELRRGINPYGYKPEPEFAKRKGENDAELDFGVENEVDKGMGAEETAIAVTEAGQGRVYCKRDGSLDSGFEIVTHPGTLAHHMYEMRWKAITKTCEKAGFKSHDTDTCGLHIHVGRRKLGSDWDERELVADKLVILFNALRDELTTFSRRKADKLEHWAAMPCLPSCRTEEELLASARDYGRYSRYMAVNRQNSATIEFRIFRGTLKRDTIIASLQLVDNLCHYAMTHTPSECNTATYQDVLGVRQFGELVAYSIERGLIPAVDAAS